MVVVVIVVVVFHTLMSISPGFKIGGSKSDRQVAPRRLVV